MRQTATPLLLGGAFLLGLFLASRLGLPWAWERMFPTPPPAAEQLPDAISVAVVARALDQAVVAAGGELPPKPGPGEAAVVPLPGGLSPRDLEVALRADPRLASASIYVTPADALLWRLRVYSGPQLLLLRELRPWLPASPPHPPGNPPELAMLVDLRDGAAEGAPRWRSPLGVVLAPFAPPTLRLAGDAAKASRSVVAALDPGLPVEEQLHAVPHASAGLLEGPLPAGLAASDFLAPLAEGGLALIDACPRGCVDPAEARRAGVPLLRLAAQLGRSDGAGEEAERALARNLAVQWGYGVILTTGDGETLARAERLIDSAKADGLQLVFVEEIARLHGLAVRPGE